MEFLTLLFSSVLGLVTPAGFVVDRVAEDVLRDPFVKVESLVVRSDVIPTHRLLDGQVARVRIAGRGLFPFTGVRLDRLDVETDPIDVYLPRLRRSNGENPRTLLEKPLQAGIRLVLTEADVNEGLRSPQLTTWLKQASIQTLRETDAEEITEQFDWQDPQITFVGNNRMALRVALQPEGEADPIWFEGETGLQVQQGRWVKLVQPQLQVNGTPVPETVLEAIATGLEKQLDLDRWKAQGMTVRFLQLKVEPTRLFLALFVQVNPLTANGTPEKPSK